MPHSKNPTKRKKESYGCGVFIDLQKAFDTVDHEILLSKLFHYGIRGHAHALFKSYLSERQQFVSISGFKDTHRALSMILFFPHYTKK